MKNFLQRSTLFICALITVWAAAFPLARAFFPAEVSYNEGWNIYAASAITHGQPLYPPAYGFTTVNYPMLSFTVMAALHHLTHDYLYTARAVSILALLLCAIFTASCLRTLGASHRSALLAALYCIAVFCAAQNQYVGVDDPQILADALFLAGFALYLHQRRSPGYIALTALTFTAAFSIKHSPIDFILAVAIDLALASLPLAGWFAACMGIFGAVSLFLHLHFGGPGFVLQLLTPRAYTATHIADRLRDAVGPLLIPFALALFVAFKLRKHQGKRILAILMATSLITGCYFAGGHGVSTNCLFGALFGMCLLLGLLCDESILPATIRPYAPAMLFLWLLIPMALNDALNLPAALRTVQAQSAYESREVQQLAAQPGPALCESLLLCYRAGKPYVYDPFNATSLIAAGKLDEQTLLNQVQTHAFSAIQIQTTLQQAQGYERLSPAAVAAIHANYKPAGTVYLPAK